MNLKNYLESCKQFVDAALTRSLEDASIPASLRKAMLYSLDAGGKRIRPILAIAAAEAVGGRADQVMPLCVALEMIHTFSLIHDDLPAMDNDDFRRGLPTNHKVFGEATAILAGDALIAEAFRILATAKNIDSTTRAEVIADVAKASGAVGMTGGQVIDMEATGKKITEQELENIHRHKTGALLTVSVVAGAKCVGAPEAQIQALKRYGEAIGLAFQIADDILDIEGNQQEIGKDVGSDVSHGKATYPAIIGIETARKKAAYLVDEAISALHLFDHRAEPLRNIARYIIERRK